MNLGQGESRIITLLCLQLGYSRQAFYQFHLQTQKEALQHDLLLQEVMAIRVHQKRLGTRKLFFMMQGFMEQHSICIGRDAMEHPSDKNK